MRCAYPEPSFLFCARTETLVGLFLRAPMIGAGSRANPPLSNMFPSAYSPIRFRQEAGMPPANCLSPLTAGRHGSHALLPRAVGRIVGIPYMMPYGNIHLQWCIPLHRSKRFPASTCPTRLTKRPWASDNGNRRSAVWVNLRQHTAVRRKPAFPHTPSYGEACGFSGGHARSF